MAMTSAEERLDPDAVLLDGSFDGTALLLLWLARKSFFPVLWIGIGIAVIVTQDIANLSREVQREIESLDSVGAVLAALASPFALILMALLLRLLVELLAFALAYPLTRWNRPSDYARRGSSGSYLRLWWDRVYLTRSFRSLRWSWAVRQSAADRLGRKGQILETLSSVLSWTSGILFAALVVVIALVA
ncbi:MAG: hypothetical protein ACR2N9_11625 [Acidimicrobiia bacterium]